MILHPVTYVDKASSLVKHYLERVKGKLKSQDGLIVIYKVYVFISFRIIGGKNGYRTIYIKNRLLRMRSLFQYL